MEKDAGRISKNVSGMALSAIKDMAMRSAKVEGAASLTWGLPSFETPEHIRQAVELALRTDQDIGKYSLPDGLVELRRAVAKTHLSATGIEINPDRNVIITAGNMEGLSTLFHVLINPDDEIIVTDPGFASHFQQIQLCGGKTVFWKMDESRDWALDLDVLPNLISDRTKAIILVTPSNPTGKIFEEMELRRIGEIARQRNIFILLDDPYSHFTYEHHAHYFNLASVPELTEHVVYLFTFSKAYAMSGWRAGYMVLPASLRAEVLKVHDATMICAPRISQIAALAALTEEPVHLAEFEAVLGKRRELICQRLDELPHVFEYVKPQGAYYIFPRILVKHADSFQFSIDLLEKARVTITPGNAFGPTGEHHVRMAYCVAEDVINQAFDRIIQHYGPS